MFDEVLVNKIGFLFSKAKNAHYFSKKRKIVNERGRIILEKKDVILSKNLISDIIVEKKIYSFGLIRI